jgi:ATP-dependent protease ClpP protease subunit
MLEGHLFTKGRITKEYPDEMKAQIDALSPDVTNIIHHIQSPGGDCYAAFNGYHEIMKVKPGVVIDSLIEGEAQSMGTFLAIAPAVATGGKVKILNPSTFMIHEPFFPEGVAGTVDELSAAQTELEQIRSAMAESYAKKTGKTVAEMMALMKKTTRLDAQMAVQMGFCDMIPPRNQAIGELINEFKEFKNEVMALFSKKPAVAAGPTAMDLPLKDGKVLNVATENGDLVGKPATIDGVPAEGTHDLADGRQIIIVAGMVAEVKEAGQATPPQESEAQRLQRELAATQAKLAQIQAAEDAKIKAAQEQEKIAAEKAAQDAQVKALEEANKTVADLSAKVAELEKKPIGNTDKPAEGMNTARQPIGFKAQAPNAVALDLTRAFINEHMTWLKPYYPEEFFKNSPSMVSILETNFNYTYPGILTTDIYYKPTLDSPALSDIFTIDQDIKFQKQYNLVTELNKIVLPYTGCGGTPAGNRQFITNTTVRTKEFQMYEGWCKDDFTGQLTGIYNNLAQEWLKTGLDSFDPAGTPIDKVIMTVLKDAMRRDIFRRVSFAAGNSTDADYNQIDGLWDRLIDSSGASNYCVVRAGAAQGIGTPAAGAALTALEAAYAASSLLLKNQKDKVYWVTRSMWDNYYNSLISASSGFTEAAYMALQSGKETLTYKGIPVRPVDLWDQFLAETDNPLFATTRNLVLLTVKSNHILGVENSADLNRIDSWFENKDQKRYYRSNFKLGYNYLHCDLQTIVY